MASARVSAALSALCRFLSLAALLSLVGCAAAESATPVYMNMYVTYVSQLCANNLGPYAPFIHGVQFANVGNDGQVNYVTTAASTVCIDATNKTPEDVKISVAVYNSRTGKYYQESESKDLDLNEAVLATSAFGTYGLAQPTHDFNPEIYRQGRCALLDSSKTPLLQHTNFLASTDQRLFADRSPVSVQQVTIKNSNKKSVGTITMTGKWAGYEYNTDKCYNVVEGLSMTAGGLYRVRHKASKGFALPVYSFFDVTDPFWEMPPSSDIPQ